jgi:hypothetical protein
VGQFKTRVKRAFQRPTSAKKDPIYKRVEYNVFLFDEPLKGSKSLKIFKISLTFRFDKLSNLSKSVHTGENSHILTVSNKKIYCNQHVLKMSLEDSQTSRIRLATRPMKYQFQHLLNRQLLHSFISFLNTFFYFKCSIFN